MTKKFENLSNGEKQPPKHAWLYTHTHTHTLTFNRNKIKKRFENAFTLAKTCQKTLSELLSTTSSPRGRRYKCGQLVPPVQSRLLRSFRLNQAPFTTAASSSVALSAEAHHFAVTGSHSQGLFLKPKCSRTKVLVHSVSQQLLMRGQKSAFTLAEVLITLAVIGIVAALTIGVFLPKIHSTIRARQIATAEVKFTKAMEQMALNNAIGPYYETTQEFVDELQNYLKISKVCDNEHLADCFGYEKLLLSNGEEFELSEIKSGENLGKNEDYLETVGLVTIDGTGMILSWNKKCDILEPKVYAWGNNTNETTSCVAAIMDINLDKSPNRINKDIALFRAESPSKEDCGMSFTVGGQDYCFGTPFTPTPLTDSDCAANKSTYGITNCIDSSYSNQDYWGGAMKQCKEQGKRLPNQAELKAIAQYLYGTQNINDSGFQSGLTMDPNKLSGLSEVLFSSYTSHGNYLYVWSGTGGTDQGSYGRNFGASSSNYSNLVRHYSYFVGVCVP